MPLFCFSLNPLKRVIGILMVNDESGAIESVATSQSPKAGHRYSDSTCYKLLKLRPVAKQKVPRPVNRSLGVGGYFFSGLQCFE